MEHHSAALAQIRPDLLKRRVPPGLRKRAEISCDNCKARKQKCRRSSADQSCNYCRGLGVTCAATKLRKPRTGRTGTGTTTRDNMRVAVLESLVQGLIPEADLADLTSMRDLGCSLGIPMPMPMANDGSSTASESQSGLPDLRERLLQDNRGTTQYIGPTSSYFFMTEVCSAVGAKRSPNTEELCKTLNVVSSIPQETAVAFTPASSSTIASEQTGFPTQQLAGRSLDVVLPTSSQTNRTVDWFFAHVHADFTVFHEPSFRETYEAWRHSPSDLVDPTWMCSLLGMLLLTAKPLGMPASQEQEIWIKAQELLTRTLLTSSLQSVQAMMVLALYLHNSNRRDACWTLTGSAIRIALAIGMHQNDVQCTTTSQTPLLRTLRKRIWWTLYAFEQMQVSSLGRPSALSVFVPVADSSSGTMMGIGADIPPDYMTWHNKLVVLLGKACQTAKNTSPTTPNAGPLSPAASLLRELDEWKKALPRHLQPGSVEYLPPYYQRPVILLHVQYYYTISLATRWALLSSVSLLKNMASGAVPQGLSDMAEACVEAGHSSCALLLKLDAMGHFNVSIWWDVFWLYSAVLTVAFGIHRDFMRQSTYNHPTAQALLRDASAAMQIHVQKPEMPPTMQRWANIVIDIYSSTSLAVVSEKEGIEEDEITTQSRGISQQAAQLRFTLPETQERYDGVASSEPLLFDPGSIDFADVGRAFQAANWEDISGMLLIPDYAFP
ncbi:hypothetical protein A1O1_06119 [Capronia coronata CBS 617.96]|uniref:Zn(2)-C6 fungal-type domain-containing protein n=1 Tax=Capronia coronata CBS 617.96 TaxID=1182541 RepID=W9Y921_9EURO|nr:uncharacterized protein A1O1_06119 [Capronia coronata CBS 617.96]EXJ85751.1 hypothetical protein A1O1_06119 [Capronia coronata CBS 617.96]